jgi:hypothetical protein
VNDQVERQDVISNLNKAGHAAGLLAKDDTTFRAAVDAFRASDAESFQRLLANLAITDCDLMCFWLRSKECVLECIQLCGLPKEAFTIEDIPKFAELVAKVTADEELIEVLATTIQDRDVKGFASLIKKLQAERFCHLLCHWACIIRWRLVCEVVCRPARVPIREFVAELATAGGAVQALLRDNAKLATVVKAGRGARLPNAHEHFRARR